MNDATSPDKQNGTQKENRFQKRILPLLMLILIIGITVVLFVFSRRYPDVVEKFGNYGYLGFFLASLVSSTSVILPVPGVIVLFPLVASLNPILLALAGSTGGIIGEITGFMAGYSGRGVVTGGKMQGRVERWFKRWGVWAIFAFAAIPLLPFDVAGVVAGAMRYPLWKFMLVGWIGKSLKFIVLVYAALWGWNMVLRYLGG